MCPGSPEKATTSSFAGFMTDGACANVLPLLRLPKAPVAAANPEYFKKSLLLIPFRDFLFMLLLLDGF
jgi:hypothetical protein